VRYLTEIGYTLLQEIDGIVMSDFDYMASAELFAAQGRSGFPAPPRRSGTLSKSFLPISSWPRGSKLKSSNTMANKSALYMKARPIH
jgi:hypothetical protein